MVRVGDLVRVKDGDGTLPTGIVTEILEPWDDPITTMPSHVLVIWNDGGPPLQEYAEDLEVISQIVLKQTN
tara:strand:+ start:104 stop:316 length:213 start_codon:yes stop_codon:yes gene_type:complete